MFGGYVGMKLEIIFIVVIRVLSFVILYEFLKINVSYFVFFKDNCCG